LAGKGQLWQLIKAFLSYHNANILTRCGKIH